MAVEATTDRGGSTGYSPVFNHPRSPSTEGAVDIELGDAHDGLLSSSSRSAAEEEEDPEMRRSSGAGGDAAAGIGGGRLRHDDQTPRGLPHGGGGGSGRTRGGTGASSFDAKGPLAAWLDSLSPRLKFAILTCCVLVSFGLHNILQESLMKQYNAGWALGLLEAVGVLAGSMLERTLGGEAGTKRVAPLRSYVLLAGVLGMSSTLSNMALNFIKYPTKVIFRSCKLVPTMAIAVVWRKKIVSRWEFLAAFSVCAGLIIFAQADARLEPDFDPRGIAMVILSVCADAFLPNMQEHVFSMGASRVEVTFFTNSLTVLGMVVSTAANGNLWEFLSFVAANGTAASYMLVYCIMSHVAIAAHMMVLKEYGGVTAVLVGTTRKSMTIALSYILFPKPFSHRFVLGGALVLGGLAANVMIKDRRKGPRAARKSTLDKAHSDSEPGNTNNGKNHGRKNAFNATAGSNVTGQKRDGSSSGLGGGGGGGGGGSSGGGGGVTDWATQSKRKRHRHQQQQQQQHDPDTGGHGNNGLPLSSWLPSFGRRRRSSAGSAGAAPPGDNNSSAAAFSERGGGGAEEPLLGSSAGKGAGSSG